jgi:methionine-rich copper-binding protein CopC
VVTINTKDVVVGESDGYADIVVSLSAPAPSLVTVNYATANGLAYGCATDDYDYLPVSGTLNFTAGETTKVVRIALSERQGVEGLEYFRFNLSSPTNAAIGQGSAMVSIVDDDTVVDTPQVFVRDVVVDEKAGTAGFVVMLGGPTGQSSNSIVTVDYATADGTAAAGSDYVARSGTLTFAPGDSVKTVVVDITDDAVPEGRERFALNLSNAIGATIVDGSGLSEIGANDATAVSQPRLSVADTLVAGESDGYVDVVVSLSAPAPSLVTVNYATANGLAYACASDDYDYLPVSGTLNFTAGETTKVVRIQLSEYQGVEGLEYFRFNLSSPTNAAIGQGSAMVSIVDDDTVVDTPQVFVRDVVVDEKAGTAGFVVMLGGPTGQSSNSIVTVDYATADGTAAAGSDYVARSGTLTFAPGDSVKTVVVDITDDAVPEGRERFALNLSNAIGATIVDGSGLSEIGANDATAVSQPRLSVADTLVVGESDGYVDVVVSLSAPAPSLVTVNYATANGLAYACASDDYDYLPVSGTLNFTAGETTKVVRIQLSEYQGVEGLEYFRFNLSSPTNAAIGQGSAMVSIVDDDTVVDTPQVFVRDVVVDEKAGTAGFVVMLGGPTGQSSNSIVTVDYATADGTAAAGSDYVARSGTLTFAPGDSVKTVVVDITDDAVPEGRERFALNLSNAIGATIVDGSGLSEIGANDATAVSQPRLSVADTLVVGESDGYVDVVVSLSAPAPSLVTVDYATTDGRAYRDYDYLSVSGTLNFAVGETTKVVRIALSEYHGVEPLESFRFDLSAPTNAAIGQGSTTVSIVDNDTVLDTPSIFVSDVVADEKVGTASFVVRLGDTQGSSSNSTVTVDYTTANGTAIASSDYLARNGTLSFAPGDSVKTVVVDLVDDNLTELAENFRLNLSNATNALIATPSASATIIANTGVTDTTAPTVSSFSPTDGATGVATSSNIVLTFSEAITRGTGSLLLKTAAGATIETFDAATSNRLTLSGSTLTIDPTSTLANGTNYYVTLAAGTIKDLAGNSYAGTSTYDFTTATGGTPPATSYTVPGTLGNDFFIPSAGNNYLGGGGNDTYVISPHTLSGAVTAKITDTEGNNVIQLVDGMTISASSFYGNAAQLTLASGAIVQILGASAFSYQVGANAPAGDTATTQTYSQFAATLGASVPTGSTPVLRHRGLRRSHRLHAGASAHTGRCRPRLHGPRHARQRLLHSLGGQQLSGRRRQRYLRDQPDDLVRCRYRQDHRHRRRNVIQWVDGMTLTASSFYNDAVQLTLSTGAKVQILGASKFNFQLGANAPAGDTATSQTYAEFASTLGVTLPAAGAAPVSGTPNFVVPSGGSAFTVVDLSSGTVTASAAAEEFRYDFQIVGGRITKAGMAK